MLFKNPIQNKLLQSLRNPKPKFTWNLILMTSSGEVTVLDIPPAIAPAAASMNARFSCPGSSIPPEFHYNLKTRCKNTLKSTVNPYTHLIPSKKKREKTTKKRGKSWDKTIGQAHVKFTWNNSERNGIKQSRMEPHLRKTRVFMLLLWEQGKA